MTTQREGREMALKFLFCQDFDISEQKLPLANLITQFQTSFNAPREVWTHMREILEAYTAHQEEVLAQIQSHLDLSWSIERLSLTDLNILKIAITEMLFLETPPKAALNEAIDLGKKYSSADSAAFINGILDKVLNSN